MRAGSEFPEPGSIAWYQERLKEEREANGKLSERNAELEATIKAVRDVVCEPCTSPHPGSDD